MGLFWSWGLRKGVQVPHLLSASPTAVGSDLHTEERPKLPCQPLKCCQPKLQKLGCLQGR